MLSLTSQWSLCGGIVVIARIHKPKIRSQMSVWLMVSAWAPCLKLDIYLHCLHLGTNKGTYIRLIGWMYCSLMTGHASLKMFWGPPTKLFLYFSRAQWESGGKGSTLSISMWQWAVSRNFQLRMSDRVQIDDETGLPILKSRYTSEKWVLLNGQSGIGQALKHEARESLMPSGS